MEINMEETKQILSTIKKDHDSSRTSKNRIDSSISRWIKEYNGDPYGNEVKNRSKIVVKDIKKQIKSMIPSIVEPFMASNSLVKASAIRIGTESSASYNADILNHQYKYEFNSLHFIKTIATILPREGTVVVKTGWEFEEKVEKKTLKGLDLEALTVLKQSVKEIENVKQDKNGLFSITAVNRKLIKNRPTSIVCRNEHIFTDPTAEKFSDSKFVIHQYDKSVSDIRKQKAIYDMDIDFEALETHASKNSSQDTALGQTRFQETYNNGLDNNFVSNAKASKKVTILEYWGEYDLDGDGINEQIVLAWVKGTDIVLRCDENPFPDKEIPFVSCVYDLEPFAMWGNGVADLISDNQKIHTAIMRGFIDNLSLSNNGQKFFRKGAIDYINMQKMSNGEKYIEVNDIEGFKDGSYNNIPASTFNVYDMVTQEAESLTGVGRNFDGIDDATIGRTAAGVNMVMSAAQKHVNLLILSISEMYKDMFTKWYKYNQAFLDDGQAFKISGQLAEVAKQQTQGEYNIELNINVDAQNQAKIQQVNMFLQQAHQMEGKIPPMVIPYLVAEMFDAFGKNEEAEQIRTYQPQPDPAQMKIQELTIRKLQLENALIQSEIAVNESKSRNTVAQALGHVNKSEKTGLENERIKQDLEHHEMTKDLDILQKGVDIDKTLNDAKQTKTKGKE